MKTIILISCGKSKLASSSKASDLYSGLLFRRSLEYAKMLKPEAIYILSAKYGLLTLDTVVEPYDCTLNTLPLAKVRTWAKKVIADIDSLADRRKDKFILLAGKRYRTFIAPELGHCKIPMEGYTIGRQLQYLKAQTHE